MNTLEITKITKLGKGKVRTLNVYKNHSFITDNGIILCNYDHQHRASKPNFKAFRGMFEDGVEENTEIRLIDDQIKIKDMEIGKIYRCKSLNFDTWKFEECECNITREFESDIYEVMFEDCRTVKVTVDQPFVIEDSVTINEEEDEEKRFLASQTIWEGLYVNENIKFDPEIHLHKMGEFEIKDLIIDTMCKLKQVAEYKRIKYYKRMKEQFMYPTLSDNFDELHTKNVKLYKCNLIKLLKRLQEFDSEFTNNEINEIASTFDSRDSELWFKTFTKYEKQFNWKYRYPYLELGWPHEDAWTYYYNYRFDLAQLKD